MFLGERLAHPPLGARASVERGVEVVITENHVNRAAPSGWMERLVRFLLLVFGEGLTSKYLAKPRSKHKQQSIGAKNLRRQKLYPKPEHLFEAQAHNPSRRICEDLAKSPHATQAEDSAKNPVLAKNLRRSSLSYRTSKLIHH